MGPELRPRGHGPRHAGEPGEEALRRGGPLMSGRPIDRFHQALSAELDALRERGTLKGAESVITRVLPAEGERGPRSRLAGEGNQPFLKMNSNNYLGMSLRPELGEAEEAATRAF